MTPEQRRDAAVAQIRQAGGLVTSIVPMAAAGDVHTVVAYKVTALGSSPAVSDALTVVQEATERDVAGLVPWEVVDDATDAE